MNWIGSIAVICFAVLLAAVYYQIGWRHGVKAVYLKSREESEEELRSAYAKGRADADNWWIRQEEEAEKEIRAS